MTAVTSGSARVGTLRDNMRGLVLQPGDEGYEESRRIWNGMIDKRPAVIARCTGPADVNVFTHNVATAVSR